MVILMLACKMEMGKSGWGLELSQRRKEGCGSSTCSCSTSLSRFGIQDSEPLPMPCLSPHCSSGWGGSLGGGSKCSGASPQGLLEQELR